MALYIRGSLCKLCGLPMEKRNEVIIFPYLVGNTHDPLFVFNNTTLHKSCVRSHPWGAVAIKQKQFVHETILPNKNRNCVFCEENITDKGQLVATGILTLDEKHPLYSYNWIEAHKRCLSNWPQMPKLVKELKKYAKSGKWVDFHPEYRAMEKLLEILIPITPGRAKTR